MASEPESEWVRMIRSMDLASQQREMLKKLIENSELLEELRKKLELIASKI